MNTIIIILLFILSFTTHLCSQDDSLSQILDDIQDDDRSLSNWLEDISEQILEPESSSKKRYPNILMTHRFQYTIQPNQGILRKIFIGSPYESYTRLRFDLYKNLSTGLLVQKDIGERSFYDHLSGFVSWNHPVYPFKLLFGNFYIRAAEGLLLSGPFSLPKNALILKQNPKRYIQTRPFLSSNEYDGFWGSAVEIGDMTSWKFVAFYSHILRDAILSSNHRNITGLDRTGYHRTYSEQFKENRLVEKTYGGIISFPFLFIDHIGLALLKTHYSPGINESTLPNERRRNYFKFSGSVLETVSLFYTKNFQNIRVSGEISPINGNAIPYIGTLNFCHNRWSFVLKSWRIPSRFQSPFGRIPADSNPFAQSVRGFMLGSVGNPLPYLKITTFWSHKKDLWRSYFNPLPVQRKEFYIQSENKLELKKKLLFRYHITSSQFYSSTFQGKIETVKQSFRIKIRQSFGTKVRFQSHFEKVFITIYPSQKLKSGINFYQDLFYQIIKPLILQIRFSAFNTCDYDSRLYEYENDIPNVFSNFAIYGRGRKFYLLLTFKPASHIRFWFKYRQITFDGVDTIGSGLTLINSDTRQDIHIQLEIRY